MAAKPKRKNRMPAKPKTAEIERILAPFEPRKRLAITRLVEGFTFAEVCDEVGIVRSTLWEWRQDPGFLNAVRDLQMDALAGAIGILKSRAQIAAKSLGDCAEHGDDTEGPHVPAARAVLDFAFRGVEFEDLVRRIEELERGEKPAEPACS